jgi:hypothetical protein
MKYYHLKRSGRNRWKVVHTSTGCVVTPLGPLNTCGKVEARKWLVRCERAAPTIDQHEAARLLVADGVPQDWKARAMALVGV